MQVYSLIASKPISAERAGHASLESSLRWPEQALRKRPGERHSSTKRQQTTQASPDSHARSPGVADEGRGKAMGQSDESAACLQQQRIQRELLQLQCCQSAAHCESPALCGRDAYKSRFALQCGLLRPRDHFQRQIRRFRRRQAWTRGLMGALLP